MLILPPTLAMGLGALAPMCSKRVLAPGKVRRLGAILAPGKRTVTSVLRVMGQHDDRHFQHDPGVLSRAPWPALRGGRLLRRWLVRTCGPTGPVVIGLAEPIARRRGEKSAAQGLERDPVRASPAPLVNARGWRGVRRRLRTPIPWTTPVWGWPLLTVGSPSARPAQERGRAPRPLLARARQAGWLVRRWRPTSGPVVVGDHP